VQSAKLSDLLNTTQDSSSSSEGGSAYSPDADVEDEGDDEDQAQWKTPSSTTVGSDTSSTGLPTNAEEPQNTQDNNIIIRNDNQDNVSVESTPIGDLAREFGVGPELVKALAERLASAGMC
jgi:hypothetical protein